tara:strand:- start:1837 stop:2520 length:684 start_codon:yes stop_codon:yes gene_type:complete
MMNNNSSKKEKVSSEKHSLPKKDTKSLGKVAVVLFLILAVVILFLIWSSSSKMDKLYFEYNGVKFTPNTATGVGYKLEVYVNEAQFPVIMSVRNSPKNIEDISIDGVVAREMIEYKSQIYVTINPEENLTGKTTVAAKEIDYFIENPFLYDIPVNSAFMSAIVGSAAEQVIKTCADSVGDTTVIWLRLGDETAVFEENGCLVVQGTDEMELIMAADRLVLTVIGIMQ